MEKQDEERADAFLNSLGRGKSMVEIENEEEGMMVEKQEKKVENKKCLFCGLIFKTMIGRDFCSYIHEVRYKHLKEVSK